ncbi:MAG TPA: heme biosynthesis HemY N-terminal domain-containing protein [Acetobacteraceae bacterium]|nr:heme biosynthesis HemY N-terminal domain-containing protein [Acetobacteraceae bacterium]
MRRVLAILLVVAVVLTAAWYVAGLPGTVTARIGATTIEASTAVAAFAAAVLFLLLHVLLRLLVGLWYLPRRVRVWRGARHRRLGETAATSAMVALAAGEAGDARHHAAHARRLLGETAQTLLLSAQAARLAGRPEEAEAALQALTRRPETAFLGFRGLLRRATERGDWDTAARLAQAAEAAHPGAVWLRGERTRLAVRAGRWEEALALTDADAPKAALGVGAAEAATDPARARMLAQRAWKDDPALAPAALAYATRLRAAGRERRAQAVIRRSWALAPHPDLADFALAPTTDKLARMQAAQRLAAARPDHPEAHMLLARAALAAGLFGEARRHAEAAVQTGLTQRRVWLLRAAIEEAADGSTEAGRAAQRDALRHAAEASPDPVWRCTACQAVAARWAPACPACDAAGTLRWSEAAPNRLLTAAG